MFFLHMPFCLSTIPYYILIRDIFRALGTLQQRPQLLALVITKNRLNLSQTKLISNTELIN